MQRFYSTASPPPGGSHRSAASAAATSFLTEFVKVASSALQDNETIQFSLHASSAFLSVDDDPSDLLGTAPSIGTRLSAAVYGGIVRNRTDGGFSTIDDAAVDKLLQQQQGVISAELAQQAAMIDNVWTPHVVFRVATISVLMALTLLGNGSLIAVIAGQPSLRRKRVSVFLVNLAVGDLMVCFVTMTTEILFVAFGQWVLGAIACKLIVYGQIVTLASTTFLLTAMSIDRYQVSDNDNDNRLLCEPRECLRTSTSAHKHPQINIHCGICSETHRPRPLPHQAASY